MRQIAWGGFGMVWEATGPGGFPVALKFVGRIEHSIRIERRALELIKGVRHPHLLAVFGTWQTRRWFIVATELADRTLADRLREVCRQGLAGIPGSELAGYLREAAEGLDALHAAGIQHRDVKPSNLLLVNGGVKVGDYGLARPLNAQAVEGVIASSALAMTPAYAPPELHNGQTSPQTDQDSLAVSYCQLRTGLLPFAGTPLELLRGHAERDPDLSMLPAAERAVVRRALAKQPEKRWPSCRDFVEAVAAVMTDTLPLRSEAVPSPASYRWRSLCLGVFCLLLIMVAAVWTILNMRGYTPEQPGVKTDPEPRRPLELRGHTDIVTRVAFAGDGLGLSASNDRTVRVWDLATGKEVHCLRGHEDAVTSIAGRAGIRHAASGGGQHDPTVRIWNLDEGKEITCLRGHRHVVRCVAFLDDRRLVSGSFDGTVRLWDLVDKKEVWSLRVRGQMPGLPEEWASQVWSLAVVPGGQEVLAGLRDGSVRKIDLERGEEVQRFAVHRNYVNAIAVSPDGQTVLTASGQRVMPGIGPHDDRVRLWRLMDGTVLQTHSSLTGFNFGLCFLADGRRAASVGIDGTVLVWDVETGKEVLRLQGHGAGVWSVATSPDGRSLLSGGDDRTVRWWPMPD